MLTSESHNDEILRFFRQNNPILAMRVVSLLNKKYGHTLVKILQRGAEIPPIFGTYKVDDITMYGLAEGIRHTKVGFDCESIAPYFIMKDLREQTRIMVTKYPSEKHHLDRAELGFYLCGKNQTLCSALMKTTDL